MKASEVLRQYAEGRRDFRGENLRGLSFGSKDLSGADFSEADIKGTNFCRANLTGAKFVAAKGGLPKQWVINLLLICLLLLVILYFMVKILSILVVIIMFFLIPFSGDKISWIIMVDSIITVVFLVFNCLLVYRGISGFNSANIIAIAITIAIVSTITKFFAIANSDTIATTAIAIGFASAIAIAIGFASAIAIGFAIGFLIGIVFTIAIGIASTIASAFAFAHAINIAISGGFDSDVDSAFFFAKACIYLSIPLYSYFGWRAIKGDPRFSWIRTNAIDFSVTGGTSFLNANLTNADFTKATLKNTDFRKAILTHTCFKESKNLDLARTIKTYLNILQVQKLVVTRQGQDKDYSRLNLRRINLQRANLANASFINADLSKANLKNADLSGAKLVQTQLDKTDFTGANLTGAYIENWRITRATKFDNVRCKYVYMRMPTKDNPNQFRKPDNNKEVFADGEFGDFIKSIVDALPKAD
ncbi:hypothetical protein NIES2119_09775 [[Phormidium ambiguum] IAM M-71]|uniref:Low-complexity protein n=1 Tax=[Phormidium ambiguum] IAM M-71 TaxID=454136 RepID=A0A1U7IM74_9CYAN|nr:pentapeptide repeat-containing protein [Phormidium ambiguum]OKH38318.1 hypothetical protein NIES2119_09775 [Phormidium ambiguum IAM M-71]